MTNTSVKKYSRYKDSGIAWIGEIPSDWRIVKTGRLFRNTKEIVGQKSASTERLALTLNGVIKRDKNDAEGLQPEQFDGYQYLRKNQLVFKLIDLENVNTSRVGLCPFEEGMVSPAYIILKNDTKDNKFYYYFFLSLWHNEVFNHLGGDGVRSALNAKDLLNVPTVNISQAEQQAIADYLDEKCGAIDKIIETEEKVIEKLKEYKQSLITETVTKGLDKSAPMKDSGISWIGEIPYNWNLTKIGQFYNERNEKVSDKNYQPLSVTKKGVMLQLETVAKTDNGDNRKLVKVNDFVINSRSDRRGSCGISDYEGSVSLINTVLIPRESICNKYYNYAFKTECFADEFYKYGNGIVDDLWSTKWSAMKNIYIPKPPTIEQQAIANYLDNKCAKIDKVIADKEQVIEKLAEYKKSLIYECVTGKRMVA